MGKITISGDSLQEISDTLDEMFSAAPASPASASPDVTAVPKATRQRRKADAPAPAQPGPEVTQASNPFTAQPQPQQEPVSPFPPTQPGPTPFAPNGATERPAVTQLKTLLNTLAAQHGEPQVYAWCIQKALGLPPTVTKEEFLSSAIYAVPDEKLIDIYHTGGGA